MAAITTRAAYDAARKTRLNFLVGATNLTSGAADVKSFPNAVSSGLRPYGIVSTPAAFGAGGTLWSNGSAGFPAYPPSADTYVGRASGAIPGTTAVVPLIGELHDMVWGCSGFAGNSIAAQNVVGFPALTRPDANGTGLELYLYVGVGAGATSTGCTVSYTNQSGVAGRLATLVWGATTRLNNTNKLLPFALEPGDTGIKSVESLTFGVAQAAAGNLWLVLGRPVGTVVCWPPDQDPSEQSFFSTGMQLIGDSAALGLVCAPHVTTNFSITCELELAHG